MLLLDFREYFFKYLGTRQVIRRAENPEVEVALFNWFLQQRNAHVSVSSEILRDTTKQKKIHIKKTPVVRIPR